MKNQSKVRYRTFQQRFPARQLALMARAQPVRARLLAAYDAFLEAGFARETVEEARESPNAVHDATATPGGPAWQWSLPSNKQ